MIEIRQATIQVLRALVAIDSVAAQAPERAELIRAWIADACHVLTIDARAAAYGVLDYHFFGCGFIEMVMVDPARRRQGLARILIEHLKSVCVHPKMFASTNRSNTQMQAVLLQTGFESSGHIDNLDPDDPELVFYCRMTPDEG
ncbi:acetyltransferase (GNAT) family protein [Stenotrophomonas rhizophila]|uniref:GNAT family N-acetyltransferase n=1 Tax=Stenotrophomonas rhizophila TaxID=216778 RepID=UPI000F9DB929|nr:GNAT family N-acetyltransferase [Stenotrophomonas rhizophila]ROP77168.1 acetyltransferase (GNAT) family protein [Stenotrophomonas rhizophila]